PSTVRRSIKDLSAAGGEADYYSVPKVTRPSPAAESTTKSGKAAKQKAAAAQAEVFQEPTTGVGLTPEDLAERIEELRSAMFTAAENLEFETAARLRDELSRLQGRGGDTPQAETPKPKQAKKRGRTARG